MEYIGTTLANLLPPEVIPKRQVPVSMDQIDVPCQG
jgi:hypothetical protein